MNIQGQLEGMIKVSRIEGLAGMHNHRVGRLYK